MTFIILTIFIDLFSLTIIYFSSLQVLVHRILIDEKFSNPHRDYVIALIFEIRKLRMKALKKEVLQFHKQSKYLFRLPLLSEVIPGIDIVNVMKFAHYLIIHTAFKLHEERVRTWGKDLDQLTTTLYTTLKGPNKLLFFF